MDPSSIADNVLRSVDSGEDVTFKGSYAVNGEMLLVLNIFK